MKLNKFFKVSLGLFFLIPTTFFIRDDILANHFSESVDSEIHKDIMLLVYGGGSGGGGKPGSLKIKKLNSKLNFKRRQLSKAAAAGEDTSLLQAEIKKLRSVLAEMY